MVEEKSNNSFVKRFARDSPGVGFGGKFASGSYKEQIADSKAKISELANKKPDPQQAFSDSGSVKNKSKTANERSFAEAARRSRAAESIYLVRGKDNGRSAWHYVWIHIDKKEMFLAKSRTGSIDVADYGDILYSGWGQDPPKEIVDKINEEYGL